MSYHAVIDGKPVGDIASTLGMGDFGRWVDSLDADTYPELCHLREHGWSQTPAKVLDELRAATAEGAMDASARSVADGLIRIISDNPDAHTLVISDGVGAEE